MSDIYARDRFWRAVLAAAKHLTVCDDAACPLCSAMPDDVFGEAAKLAAHVRGIDPADIRNRRTGERHADPA